MCIINMYCHTCIDSWLFSQSIGGGLNKRRHKTQFDVVLLQESVLVNFPHVLNVAKEQLETGQRLY